MCCMMTTVTTYISGTNSHLEKSGSPISRASLHGHTSIFNRKSKRHLSLPFLEGLTLCHNSKLGKILLLPRTIHVISLATKGRWSLCWVYLIQVILFTNKDCRGWTFSDLSHDRLFHRSYSSSIQYLIKSWTSLRMSHRAENTHSILTLHLRPTLDSQSDKTKLLATDIVWALIRAIEKDKNSCLN